MKYFRLGLNAFINGNKNVTKTERINESKPRPRGFTQTHSFIIQVLLCHRLLSFKCNDVTQADT